MHVHVQAMKVDCKKRDGMWLYTKKYYENNTISSLLAFRPELRLGE